MQSSALKPLCVDLDGTLIHSDVLLETVVLLIKRNPCFLFLLPFWLMRGKAALKAEIEKRVEFNPAALPYNSALLTWLTQQAEQGRELWLCTASNEKLAKQVAQHLNIFKGVLASSGQLNLSGKNKAQKLVEVFGDKGFDYCGNHEVDLAIWQVSNAGVVVNGSRRLLAKAGRVTRVLASFPAPFSRGMAAVKAMRLHQWAKNVLIFVPLAAAHKLGDLMLVRDSLLAFLAFGLCASSAYLLNDMLDLAADRIHPSKCHRPMASGALPLLAGLGLMPFLLLLAIALASCLPKAFCLVLFGYYVLTLAYSFGLKRQVMVDTITLAGLYTSRIVAGAQAILVPLSFWLLLFSVFLFFSLALVKRYIELDGLRRQGKLKAAGRGYRVDDLQVLLSLGAASGNVCVLVLALYINSPAISALYRHPQVIWFLCILMFYWICRIWFKAHRGEVHDDPVLFALKDRTSLLIALLALATVWVAS